MVDAIDKLVDSLSKLPTIGRKSALRLALHLVERPDEELSVLAERIGTLKSRVKICRECMNYSNSDLCEICSSPSRNRSQICVVEKSTDVFTLEKSRRFLGVYHILGGLLSPINGITPDKLNIGSLKNRIEKIRPSELILGLGGSSDGETTSLYLARQFGSANLRITRFARGLPAGMDLEYVDQLTLTQALQERTAIQYDSR